MADRRLVDAARLRRGGRRLASAASEASVDVAAASRRQARRSARRLRERLTFIGQCAAAAVVAYSIAHYVFHVGAPLFAPVAAIVALGMSHGQRLRRAVEITVGVLVGVTVSEFVLHLIGVGPLQVGIIVFASMAIAAWLGAGVLMTNQAGIQGMIVALLAGTPAGTGYGRWFEALIGSVVAIVFAAVVPSSVVRKPRQAASEIIVRLADLLADIADALATRDREAAEQILDRARDTEDTLTKLRGYVADSRDLAAVSFWYRGHREDIEEVAGLLEPLDRAIRNARVLIRRSTVMLQLGDPVPASYVHDIARLADAIEHLGLDLLTGDYAQDLERRLLVISIETLKSDRAATLSAEVVRAQIRSIEVDLLMMLGLTVEQAQEHVRHPMLDSADADDPLL